MLDPKKFCKPSWRFTTRSPQLFVDFLLQDKNRPQHSVLFNNPNRTSYEISRNVISSVLLSLPRHILVFLSYAMPHLWKHKLKLQSNLISLQRQNTSIQHRSYKAELVSHNSNSNNLLSPSLKNFGRPDGPMKSTNVTLLIIFITNNWKLTIKYFETLSSDVILGFV